MVASESFPAHVSKRSTITVVLPVSRVSNLTKSLHWLQPGCQEQPGRLYKLWVVHGTCSQVSYGRISNQSYCPVVASTFIGWWSLHPFEVMIQSWFFLRPQGDTTILLLKRMIRLHPSWLLPTSSAPASFEPKRRKWQTLCVLTWPSSISKLMHFLKKVHNNYSLQ